LSSKKHKYVFVNPFQEALEQLAKERAEEAQKQAEAVVEAKKQRKRNEPLKVYREGVAKYLNLQALKASRY